jgi:hypothetical protein
MGKFAYLVEELNKTTPEEVLQDLIRIGVYDEEGNLTEKYGGKKRASQEKTREGGEPPASAGAPSKPADGPRKAATPSGKSNQMGTTGSELPQEPEQTGLLASLVEQFNKLSPAESRDVLIRAGIIDEEGKLAEKYRQPAK